LYCNFKKRSNLLLFQTSSSQKKEGFKKAAYFNIEYEKLNQDPVKKSKELPAWAKGVDTSN
jgi:hypothetical protein